MLSETVYSNGRSPYRRLLEASGYRFDNIKTLVDETGIEETLKVLCAKGIYIDILEFKGKRRVVRKNVEFAVSERDFSNPLLTRGVGTSSGGTSGTGSRMIVPLDYIREHNPYNVLAVHGYGISQNPAIIWLPILPAGEGLFFNLRFAAMGLTPVKWFSQVDESHIHPSTTDKMKTLMTIWMARYYGKRMPKPEYVDMRDTAQIARWMHNHRERHPGFTVVTYASSALRLVLTARRENLNLGATVFWLMGEPLTEKIQEEIQNANCTAYSLFGCNEIMIIGHGCAHPKAPDDMHLCSDKLALIQRERPVEHSDHHVNAFLFTTLLKSSPKIFLNTETGDYGDMEERACGCRFEGLGFNQHIHTVRSFEKLTAEGATFIGSDLLPLIQSTLPSEFGGNATDYQFIEEADNEGVPRLYMMISPELGDVNEERVKDLILEGLTQGEYSHDYSRSYWTQADTIRIRRERPIPTPRGKIVPLLIRSRVPGEKEVNTASPGRRPTKT